MTDIEPVRRSQYSEDRVTRINPLARRLSSDLKELWEYRDVLYFLAWRDLKVRYKQTVLGVAWAALQPFATMVIFTLIFGGLARIPSDGAPYAAFSLAGLVPWTFFSYVLTQTSNSLVNNRQLITKVYFPRIAIPFATVVSGLVDLAIAFLLLIAVMAYFSILPTGRVIWILPLVVMAVVTSFGVGLWLSALNVRYRDIRYVVPFLTQFWLFATPIAYPSSLIPEPWRTVYGLNPMAGVVEGFRWALLGTAAQPSSVIFSSVIAATVIVGTGTWYFRHMERHFADQV